MSRIHEYNQKKTKKRGGINSIDLLLHQPTLDKRNIVQSHVLTVAVVWIVPVGTEDDHIDTRTKLHIILTAVSV